MKKAFAIIFLIGLILYALINTASNGNFLNQGEVGLEKGNYAPNFELMSLSGSPITLNSLQGKKVLLNFWASWCGPCQAEMPEMVEFYTAYEQDIEIIAVNMTNLERRQEDIDDFVTNYNVKFPVLLDKKGTVGELYQVRNIPTTFFIDSEGRIQERISGVLSYDQMIEMKNKLK